MRGVAEIGSYRGWSQGAGREAGELWHLRRESQRGQGQLKVRARTLVSASPMSQHPSATYLSHKQYGRTCGVKSHGVCARAGGKNTVTLGRSSIPGLPPQRSCQHPPTQACPDQCHHIDANINADDEAQQQQDGVAQVLAVVGVGALIRGPPRPWPFSHGHGGP